LQLVGFRCGMSFGVATLRAVVHVGDKNSGDASQAGARKVSGQAVGSRKVSGQAACARNVSGQAAGARKASSQPSAAENTANQGPRQGFQGLIADPASGSQRMTKKLVYL
nr:hypothetical protein [Tanacetum cinerariifolium]